MDSYPQHRHVTLTYSLHIRLNALHKCTCFGLLFLYIAHILYASYCELLHIPWSIFYTFLQKLYSTLVLKTDNVPILYNIFFIFFIANVSFLYLLTLQYFLFILSFLSYCVYCYAPNTKANSLYSSYSSLQYSVWLINITCTVWCHFMMNISLSWLASWKGWSLVCLATHVFSF